MNSALAPLHVSWPRHHALPRALKLAIVLSLGIHALVLLVRLAPPASDSTPAQRLDIVLRSPLPAPVPQATAIVTPPDQTRSVPQPRAAEPLRPPFQPRPQVPSSPPALNRPALRQDMPTVTASAPPAPQTTAVTAAVPSLVAETSATPAVPSASRPTPVEAAPPPATEETLDPALLERYGRSLSSHFAHQQNYPRLAAMRGWEGEVQVRLTIARRGNIVAAQVVRSSGFEVLDQSAVHLVSTAGPLPRPPEALQNRELKIVVPVLFKLEKPV